MAASTRNRSEFFSFVASVLVVASLGWPTWAATKADSVIGDRIADFRLRDFRGKEHALSDYDDAQLVVVCFMGTQCPLAKLYGARLERMHQSLAGRNVVFLGVYSNQQDSMQELAAFARDHEIHFPLLKDLQCTVADTLHATRTPQVVVLDAERRIRYHGRIDAQYTFGAGVGLAQPVAKRNDLQLAIDELLAGKDVSVPLTEAKGCLIGRAKQPRADATVTYSDQIARLFQQRCVECHREGQIAPFTLTDYSEAAGWGEMIAEVVREQRMPPWHANPAHGSFANENRLTDTEKELIYAWVNDGCPEGDPADLPAPHDYPSGWLMPQEPDQVIYMTDAEVDIKAEGIETYRYYKVDPGFQEDKWVTIAECMPSNPAVVHHIIVYVQSPEAKDSNIGEHELLVGFAPGARPVPLRKGWARRIPAGSQLIFEMHYTPIGTPQKDRSRLGLVFTERAQVTHHVWTTNAINTRIEIPAKTEHHRELASKQFDEDVLLISLFPHMHMRGKAFRYEVAYPDGSAEILLDVPQYDFNWQNSFILREPKRIPEGTKMVCTADYDNSSGNLANPDPSQVVRWGQQTWEEMLIGWHDVAVPLP